MNLAIGIDLGGTSIKYGLIDPGGEITWSSTRPTEANRSGEGVYENLRFCIDDAMGQASETNSAVIGIGIGIPGIIEDGILVGGANNIPDWEMVPIKSMLEKEFNRPSFVENDANLMGLAESRFGSAMDANDIIFVTIGTGIGGAMIMNGKPYGGYRNRGGEFGHIIIQMDGRLCSCGTRGCFEQYASVNALIDDYRDLINTDPKDQDPEIDGKLIVRRYLENDEHAVMALNKHFDYLAVGIGSLINIFGPEKVVLGGGITEAGDLYIENVRQRIFSIAMKETSVNTKIVRASLGNDAGMLGASILVFDNVPV